MGILNPACTPKLRGLPQGWGHWGKAAKTVCRRAALKGAVSLVFLADGCPLMVGVNEQPQGVCRFPPIIIPIVLNGMGTNLRERRRSVLASVPNYSKNSSSTFLMVKISSARQPTSWRIIKRASWSPSIRTMRLLSRSAVSRAGLEKLDVVTNSP